MSILILRSSPRRRGPRSFARIPRGDERRGPLRYPSPKALGPRLRGDERRTRIGLGIALSLAVLASPVLAQEPAAPPDRPLADAGQEARAQGLFEGLRCVVCQHESIADSPAGIAGDMRRLVREEIAAGATDAEIEADMVRRYGDYVLFQPPVRTGTWLLWFGPLALVVAGGGVLFAVARRRAVEAPALSADEERRLDEVLQTDRSRPDADASSPHDGRQVTATDVPGDVGKPAHRPISD